MQEYYRPRNFWVLKELLPSRKMCSLFYDPWFLFLYRWLGGSDPASQPLRWLKGAPCGRFHLGGLEGYGSFTSLRALFKAWSMCNGLTLTTHQAISSLAAPAPKDQFKWYLCPGVSHCFECFNFTWSLLKPWGSQVKADNGLFQWWFGDLVSRPSNGRCKMNVVGSW